MTNGNNGNTDLSTRALGWTSVGIGMTEIAAPQWLQEQLGVEDHQTLLRALGIRELISGWGILSGRLLTVGLWSRVLGDAMDLVLLGVAAKNSRRRTGIAIAGAMVAGITLLDALAAQRRQRQKLQHSH
jgi:hypothetical protein